MHLLDMDLAPRLQAMGTPPPIERQSPMMIDAVRPGGACGMSVLQHRAQRLNSADFSPAERSPTRTGVVESRVGVNVFGAADEPAARSALLAVGTRGGVRKRFCG